MVPSPSEAREEDLVVLHGGDKGLPHLIKPGVSDLLRAQPQDEPLHNAVVHHHAGVGLKNINK